MKYSLFETMTASCKQDTSKQKEIDSIQKTLICSPQNDLYFDDSNVVNVQAVQYHFRNAHQSADLCCESHFIAKLFVQ